MSAWMAPPTAPQSDTITTLLYSPSKVESNFAALQRKKRPLSARQRECTELHKTLAPPVWDAKRLGPLPTAGYTIVFNRRPDAQATPWTISSWSTFTAHPTLHQNPIYNFAAPDFRQSSRFLLPTDSSKR